MKLHVIEKNTSQTSVYFYLKNEVGIQVKLLALIYPEPRLSGVDNDCFIRVF